MYTTRYTFEVKRQSSIVETYCNRCGKRLKRTVWRTYTVNPFHDVQKTREKNWESIKTECAALADNGTRCRDCDGLDLIDGLPRKPKPKRKYERKWPGPTRFIIPALANTVFECRTETAQKAFMGGLYKRYCDEPWIQIPNGGGHPDSRVIVIDEVL